MHRSMRGLLVALVLVGGLTACKPNPKVTEDPKVTVPAEAPPDEAAPATSTRSHADVLPPAPDAPLKVRIVAWNLEWFPGHKPEPTRDAEAQHMQAAKAALAELKPDVLLLEEVRDWESAQELCKAVPGIQVHVVSRFQPRPQNQVIASKFPADSTWSDSWQTDVVTPPRGYAFAALELPSHRYLLTYALHLKSNLGEFPANVAQRQAAAKQLLLHSQEMLALYGKRGPSAVVIGGDMNTSIDDPKFAGEQTLPAFIKAGFRWTHEGVPFAARTTIPASGSFPDNCFDHIFAAGLGNATASVKSLPGISDHNPVVLDVDLSKADFQPTLNAEAGLALLKAPSETPAAGSPMNIAATVNAADSAAITGAIGKAVIVKGRVQNVGTTPTNSIYFINFAGVPKGGFVGIVKKEGYSTITAALGADLKAALTGKDVELRGELVRYKETPEIVVTSPEQIKIVQP
jgi:endonuclease/exonuclease/phosphatase family metal-dependent hydrolase